MSDTPMTRPGETAGWPKLVIRYRTEPERIAALLPPGIEPGSEPVVQLGIYCVPVHDEPEYGVSTKVAADFDGIAGQYTLGIGIDQEAAIFISQETNGQPKFPCRVHYFRLGDTVEARCIHQGYTFLSFRGTVSGTRGDAADEFEDNEWWIKSIRAVGGAEKSYDYPPHVVRVRTAGRTIHTETLDGELTLNDSPWDPHTERLPMVEYLSAELVTNRFSAREITNAGPLDPDAFWPHADTIGGSRWPGDRGGPRRS